jgi:hypothetical protein
METEQEEKQRVLKMPKWQAELWCLHHRMGLNGLWMQEMMFIDDRSRMTARSIEGMMGVRSRYSIIHEQRAAAVRVEKDLTHSLIALLTKMDKVLKGEEQNPFPNELDQDEARAWVAESRTKLMEKIRHERAYLKKCEKQHEQPHQYAAKEKDIEIEQAVLGFLNELLKTFPPLRLPRPKLKTATIAPGETA